MKDILIFFTNIKLILTSLRQNLLTFQSDFFCNTGL